MAAWQLSQSLYWLKDLVDSIADELEYIDGCGYRICGFDFDCGLNGFKIDESGCEICECNEPDDKCNTNIMMECMIQCVHGYDINEYGCPECRCLSVSSFTKCKYSLHMISGFLSASLSFLSI